ncbi:MAG: N-6 DNA methylase [Clostridiales bacterium]|nr:N-6 DNA methylase [Clostridiales bacterium]
MKNLISKATQKNWDKLKPDTAKKLVSRANKRLSEKTILPVEYVTNDYNLSFVQELLQDVQINGWKPNDVIFSIAYALLEASGISNRPHVRAVLEEKADCNLICEVLEYNIPLDEVDLLGLVYQSMLNEGKKNVIGSYYTPLVITSNMVGDFAFTGGKTFFDPCCGSGAYFFALNNIHPNQIFGIDNDPMAVFICKINLLIKFKDYVFSPQIYCMDYLKGHSLFSFDMPVLNRKYDYIATNPPWGAITDSTNTPVQITSNESFSCFFVKAYEQLNDGGVVRFLFPEAILNVKAHKDIRSFMLDRGNLSRITIYPTSFAGVTTKYVDIEVRCGAMDDHVSVFIENEINKIPKLSFKQTKNKVFSLLNERDICIIDKIRDMGCYTLSQSIWALGIVTGDNKGKLEDAILEGYEPIYTGKEIQPYTLKPAKKYILYDRSQLQQVAKDEYYRAPEKLVYKFISDKLIFAYDDSGSLFLNSANILIPNIPNMSIKTVLAFLNSELFQYMYSKIFGEIKILKGNLMELLFPLISPTQDLDISAIVNDILAESTSTTNDHLQNIIYNAYDLSEGDRRYIRRTLSRKN